MRYVENCGVKKACLETGYEDTGVIPEIGESVLKAETRQHEKAELAKKYGMEDENTGGFLGRDDGFGY
jgi:hypothetical protein